MPAKKKTKKKAASKKVSGSKKKKISKKTAKKPSKKTTKKTVKKVSKKAAKKTGKKSKKTAPKKDKRVSKKKTKKSAKKITKKSTKNKKVTKKPVQKKTDKKKTSRNKGTTSKNKPTKSSRPKKPLKKETKVSKVDEAPPQAVIKSKMTTGRILSKDALQKKRRERQDYNNPQSRKPSTEKIQVNKPILKIIVCGPKSVYCLDSSASLSQEDFVQILAPEELGAAKKFKSPKRRQEFLRGRWTFHHLARIRDALLNDADGVPMWPSNIVASISHSNGNIFLGLGNTENQKLLGLDAQELKLTFAEKKILNPEESYICDRVEAISSFDRQRILMTIFSFKEALFKAYFPKYRQKFSWKDIRVIDFDHKTREIRAEVPKDDFQCVGGDKQILGYFTFHRAKDGKEYTVCMVEKGATDILKDIRSILFEN